MSFGRFSFCSIQDPSPSCGGREIVSRCVLRPASVHFLAHTPSRSDIRGILHRPPTRVVAENHGVNLNSAPESPPRCDVFPPQQGQNFVPLPRPVCAARARIASWQFLSLDEFP